MRNAIVPTLSASILVISLIGMPAKIDDPGNEYAEFLAKHDLMHLVAPADKAPEQVVIRKAFWQQDKRILMVDARTPREKGELLVLEGYPDSTFVHEFRISSDFGAVFELPLAGSETVPCRIIIRSGHDSTVVDVSNAPGACAAST